MLNLQPLQIEDAMADSYQVSSPFQVPSKAELPVQARSVLRSEQASLLSGGITSVISQLLLGKLSLKTTDNAMFITNHREFTAIGVFRQGADMLYWGGVSGKWQETVMLALGCALTTDLLPATAEALQAFIQALAQAGLRYPFTAHSLHASVTSQPLYHALARLADTIDAEVDQQVQNGKIQVIPSATATRLDEHVQDVPLAECLYPPKKQVENTHLQRLERLIDRGGTALLVGPPGTFKTETAKLAAVQSGASLVIAKGSPGVEDRDFIGGVYPSETGGAAWVHGPLSRAFVAAATRKTVLLIDEALRYLPETLSVLIGTMDTYSHAEVKAMNLDVPGEVGRYYVLPLPNGKHLVCPAQNLTWILTTNMGADHHQVTDRLDAALQSRLDMELYFGVPAKDKVLKLYEQACGSADLARLGHRAEVMTRDLLEGDRRCLERPLEARKVLAVLRETRSMMDHGIPMKDAFLDAFMTVAVPYCCKHEDQGAPEFGMSAMLKQRVVQDVLEAI